MITATAPTNDSLRLIGTPNSSLQEWLLTTGNTRSARLSAPAPTQSSGAVPDLSPLQGESGVALVTQARVDGSR